MAGRFDEAPRRAAASFNALSTGSCTPMFLTPQARRREAERGPEDVRLHMDAMLLGDVAHVQADHQRQVQRQQFGSG